MLYQPFPPISTNGPSQRNILIDKDFHPRLTDYGFIPIVSDPGGLDSGPEASPYAGAARYMAPELLDPPGSDPKNGNPTKKSDIYAFGVVTYQVSDHRFISGTMTEAVFRWSQDSSPSLEPRTA